MTPAERRTGSADQWDWGPMSEATRALAERAASQLGPEADLFGDHDAAGFGAALTHVLRSTAGHPLATARAAVRFADALTRVPLATTAHWMGGDVEGPVPLDPKDMRFADPAWDANPLFHAVRLSYLASCRFVRDVVGSADVDAGTAGKAALATELMLDAVAPTNFLATNPAALKLAFDTSGVSLAKGARNFVDDVRHNQGRPRQVDTRSFEVGRNLAATPAKVVYRNDLMELLQYEPQTETGSRESVAVQPAVDQQVLRHGSRAGPQLHRVGGAARPDRLRHQLPERDRRRCPASPWTTTSSTGPQAALDVIQEITGADTIDIVGLCLGGALTAITDAYLRQSGDSRIGTLTLLNTMLDYSRARAARHLHRRRTVESSRRRCSEGVLEGASMAGTFDVLRANDLIFNYVVSNWLIGQDPPAFDILAWNADSTRMPAAMHAFYLRNFYVENKLAAGTLEIAGQTIDLSAIKSPTYIVSAINDHIVPWQSAYKSTGLCHGAIRFVLSSGGHIAGIVNPPGPKAWYQVGASEEVLPSSAVAWRDTAERRNGSWWTDWTQWSDENSGPMQEPPPMGSDRHPALGAGPGTYVRT